MLIGGLHGVQSLLAIADWAAEDDEAVAGERVKKGRVLVPAVLFPDLARAVPAWAMHESHCEIGHERSVVAAADRQPAGQEPPDVAWLVPLEGCGAVAGWLLLAPPSSREPSSPV